MEIQDLMLALCENVTDTRANLEEYASGDLNGAEQILASMITGANVILGQVIAGQTDEALMSAHHLIGILQFMKIIKAMDFSQTEPKFDFDQILRDMDKDA